MDRCAKKWATDLTVGFPCSIMLAERTVSRSSGQAPMDAIHNLFISRMENDWR
jgi:hypothetical protein